VAYLFFRIQLDDFCLFVDDNHAWFEILSGEGTDSDFTRADFQRGSRKGFKDCCECRISFIRAEGLIPRPLGRMKGSKSRLQYLLCVLQMQAAKRGKQNCTTVQLR
jgi:hypothetical protein